MVDCVELRRPEMSVYKKGSQHFELTGQVWQYTDTH